MGRESLAVYVAHLLVLYGSAMNPMMNLQVQLGAGKTLGESILIAAGLTAAMFAFAQSWHTLKRDHPTTLRIIQLAASGVFVYFLFTRDF
jgi:ABC-type branched-subunit amino acid transport system permease subunit